MTIWLEANMNKWMKSQLTDWMQTGWATNWQRAKTQPCQLTRGCWSQCISQNEWVSEPDILCLTGHLCFRGVNELKLSVKAEYSHLLEDQKQISDGLLVCGGQWYMRPPDPLCKESNGSNMCPKAYGRLFSSHRCNLFDALGMHIQSNQWRSSQPRARHLEDTGVRHS